MNFGIQYRLFLVLASSSFLLIHCDMFAFAQSNGNEIGENQSITSLLSSLFTQIQGKYVNPNIGFSIDLPTGWKGIQSNFLFDTVTVSPRGVNEKNIGQQELVMSIISLNNDALRQTLNFTKSLNANDSLLELTKNYTRNIECTAPSSTFVNINGVNAEENIQECTGENYTKVKSYLFMTKNDSLIVVAYHTNSTENYNKNISEFENSVKTIRISEPGDIKESTIYQDYKKSQEQLLRDLLDNPDF